METTDIRPALSAVEPLGGGLARACQPYQAALLAGLILAGMSFQIQAQEAAAPRRAWSVTPRISVSETLTDNVAVSAAGKGNEQITEITPGVSIRGESARLKGSLDYQLHELIYAQDSTRNQTQHTLNGQGTLEGIEKWLFVDASAAISQQSISAFGVQSPSNASINANRTETSNFQLSPYVRGRLAGYADYELRYRQLATRAKSSQASDMDVEEFLMTAKGGIGRSRLSWLMESTWNNTDYTRGRATEAERLRAFLTWQGDPQWKASLIGGTERNNYLSLEKERKSTVGVGFDWTPNERTRLSMLKESRFFGHGHSLDFNYRLPLVAVAYSDSRDVSTQPNQVQRGSLSATDLVDSLLSSLFPDPVVRADEVTRFFRVTGLSPNAMYDVGFLASQVSVQRLRRLSLVTYGARNAVTLSATESERTSLNPVTSVFDDFALSPSIRQRGFSASWAYRLSPLSSVNLTASQQHSVSSSASNLDTKQKSFNLSYTTRLGNKTTASLALRRTLFDSLANPYSENEVVGTLTFLF